ncbi:MAG: hypothetical protein ACI8QI_001103 [Limisphaerales bacterium]|jgi:hypothetical protein
MNLFSARLPAKRCVCPAALLLGLWVFAWPAFAEPRINEFLAVNNRGLADGDGEALDWIEIYNPGAKAVSLGGWALSDDAASPDKWLFPDIALGPRKYLVVFASGKDRADATEPHTNFKLNGGGEYLGLFKPDAAKAVSEFPPAYPRQRQDISFGQGAGGKLQFFDKPTPGRANGSGFDGFVADTKFKPNRGFFDAPFRATLTAATPGATIRYTLDGSRPTAAKGKVYAGPIAIDTTATLRAAAFKPGLRASNVDTHTYLFAGHIASQPARPAGFPAKWNGHSADYEMDPDVVDDPKYRGRVAKALKAIPTLSLVLNRDDFFKTGQGIYPKGEGVEKAVSMELIYPGTGEGIQGDGSVQIVGGSSTRRWKTDKLSMRIKFTSRFGDTSFRHPIFGDKATGRFDTLIVDARLANVWSYGGGVGPSNQRARGQYVRDQYTADLQNQMGGHAPHGFPVHVYVCGIYWGLHMLHERPDEHFAAAYLGGSKEDYDVMKHRRATVVSGSSRSYNALISATSKNLTSAAAYANVRSQLDVAGFIDYLLINYYTGNFDWSHQNWYASFNRNIPDGRWLFHSWDAEHNLESVNENVTGRNNAASPTGFHHQLRRNAEYRVLFGDRVHRHFFNNGVMTPERAAESYLARLDEVDEAVVAESARWGDSRRSKPFTRDKEWAAEKNRLLKQYFPKRSGIVLKQLRGQNLYPSLDAPTLSQHGGLVAAGFSLTLTAPKGEIHYTLDGTDPRLPGGALADTANRYSNAVAIAGTVRVKSRARFQNQWSALTEARFVVEGSLDALRVTELMYHPLRGQAEFVELKNTGDTSLDLGGVTFSEGIRFTFAEGFQLAPGAYVVLTGDAAAFTDQFPGVALGGVFDGRLSNGSEKLVLSDSLAKPFLSLTYSDQPPWPSQADGQGFSLVAKPLGQAGDPNLPASWRPSATFGGSPGREDRPSETGNAPPYVSAGPNRVIETDSIPVAIRLAGNVRDDAHPSFPSVSLEWSLDGDSAPVQFAAAESPGTSANLFGLGQHTFRLTASDGEHTASDTVTIEIRRVATERGFIAAGAEWRYLDNGSNQGTRWHARLFNDDKWKTGAAQLGYGDNDEKTKLSFGGDSGNKHVTTFFRHAFEVADPAGVTSLEGALLRDDGAVVYLNRREVTRSNMPQGSIGYTTFASTTAGGADESAFHSFAIDAALLVKGKNVIAVEVHQANRSSSDISFDFALSGKGSAANQPPTVQSFAELTAAWPSAVRLVARVSDDALPIDPGRLAMRWSVQSGPGTVTLADDSLPVTTAWFSKPGRYVIGFSAYDGQTVANRELVVHANGDAFAAWRRAHFSDAELGQPKISAPSADPDRDGMGNLAEYIAGTEPRDAKSRLAIGPIELDAGDRQLTVHFHTTPQRRYRLLQSPAVIGPWRSAGELIGPPNGGPATFVVPLGQAQFFRLEIPAGP